nr:hypothetical protein [Paraburkholderia sp. BCC1885]
MTACSVLTPTLAHADDWGCQVLLCLANPGGPEQYSECVPPIERLWSALRHGDPFPTCDFGSGGAEGSQANAGTSASNTFASAGYCREDLLHCGGPEDSELLCGAAGAINVEINGQLYTRVWWDTGGGVGVAAPGESSTLTEYYGAGSTQMRYDPTQAAREFLEQQYRWNNEGGGGGQ